MKVQFWGAAQTTTGSLHLLEAGGHRVALDCGLFQGRRAEANVRNREFPGDVRQWTSVVLSHAHIDHCGNLPNAVSLGFSKEIFCTEPTAEMASVMLLDSARIQESDAEFLNKRRSRRSEDRVEPLYTTADAEATNRLFHPVPLHVERKFAPSMSGFFSNAGHILGSAVVTVDFEEKSLGHRLVFSGDIGRKRMALLSPVAVPDHAETLICESTYGNRLHEPEEDLKTRLLDIVRRTAERGGKVIIPAFAVGRTQDIVYRLNQLFEEGLLPRINIYVDSPLAINVTDIFRRHPDYYNREAYELLQHDEDIFGFRGLRYVRNPEESKSLNALTQPAVIIAASGMCEAGRILHHLRNSVEDPRNTILIVGFQAEHTLGRRILERQPVIRIFGEEHALRAEVVQLEGFSAHADADELKDFIFRVRERSGGRLRRVFLVHGEHEAQESLQAYVRDTLGLDCHVPARGDAFEL